MQRLCCINSHRRCTLMNLLTLVVITLEVQSILMLKGFMMRLHSRRECRQLGRYTFPESSFVSYEQAPGETLLTDLLYTSCLFVVVIVILTSTNSADVTRTGSGRRCASRSPRRVINGTELRRPNNIS
jgi:hypothetical protein